MIYKKLALKAPLDEDKKLLERFENFNLLTQSLAEKDVPSNMVNEINEGIEKLNNTEGNKIALLKEYRALQNKTIRSLEKELKIVPLNHYRNLWMVLGMSAIGLPIGLVLGNMMGNIGLMGIGMPIGMGIGVVLGTMKDKKAMKEGKQLNVGIKY